MDTGVFLMRGDNTLIRMRPQPYAAESLLQGYLADHPDLLAGDQIDPSEPRRWILLAQEAGVPATHEGADWWAIDHLFLDQDAIPTFVEVKRASDTRARREVVAQMLDYAANATAHWPVDKMRGLFEARCAARAVRPEEELDRVFGPGVEEAAYWNHAKTNLQDGRVRLLFVADHIPLTLRRIIEFLNRQMDPAEVLAVEVRQFAPENEVELRTLVPRVIGQTEQAREKKVLSRSVKQETALSRKEFVAWFSDERTNAGKEILKAADHMGFVTAYVRTSDSTVLARVKLTGDSSTPISIDNSFLFVSLGRHHDTLREPVVNQKIRQAILSINPSLEPASDLKKTEVGIPLSTIATHNQEQLRRLFGILKEGLQQE